MGPSKIVALSGSSKETAAYAKHLGKRLRYITNKDTMRSEGFGVTEIHYLPGWNKRRDRHAIASVVTHIRRARARRGSPLIEKHLVRLPDGMFVDQDYRGPELDPVAETQEAQLDGLRQMHVPVEVVEQIEDNRAHPERSQPRPVRHLPQTITAEEAAEEQGIEVDSDEFFDFLEGKT